MTAGYDTLVTALEKQFDFHSARVVAREASVEAGIADRSEWSEDDLKLALAHIAPIGKDLRPVMEHLGLAPDEPTLA